MSNQHTEPRLVLLTLPGLVLLGYGLFITRTYWPYLNEHLRLRSPELAGLPEDVIGFGFWMWWPFIALLLLLSLALALFLSGTRRRLYVGTSFLGIFALLSIADYLLCQRLVQELISH
jgi:hypothetical protein